MRFASLRYLVILFFSLDLMGCMLGPNFHSPAAPDVTRYTANPQPVKTIKIPEMGAAGKSQYFEIGADIPRQWWYLYHSPEMNNLITAGMVNSPNLAAARATLVQAREALYAQIGSTLLPAVSGQLGAERQLFQNNDFDAPGSSLFSLYTAEVSVSYTVDIFGALRRQVESVRAQMDYEAFELQAAYLTLTSNIVTTAINIASLRTQIAATQQIIHSEEQSLNITRKQYKYGGVAGLNVLSQQSQLYLTRATLPPLEQNLAQARHAMSVLIGRFPSEDEIPDFDFKKLSLPAHLPVSLPSQLVRQRPDIRASEALLHSASAQIGVATANLFPQLNLSGAYGWQALMPGALFNPSSRTWNWGGTLLQPIFEGGSLLAKRRGSIAAYNVAAAQYKQTVLTAFQNVADTLRALDHDAHTLKEYRDAEIAAQKAWNITKIQYKEGGINYLSLLTAETQYQQAVISRVQAEALRYSDTAALFQALGGGWWNCATHPLYKSEGQKA
jgi:NodT family efflux transporter outer membrane factor (OMF) lipoprotein